MTWGTEVTGRYKGGQRTERMIMGPRVYPWNRGYICVEIGGFCDSRVCHKNRRHVEGEIKSIHASALFSQAVQAGLGAAKQQRVEDVFAEMGLVWHTWLSLGAYRTWKESRSSWMPHGMWTMHAGCNLARGKDRPSRIWDGVTGKLKHHVVPDQQEVMAELFGSNHHALPILEEQTLSSNSQMLGSSFNVLGGCLPNTRWDELNRVSEGSKEGQQRNHSPLPGHISPYKRSPIQIPTPLRRWLEHLQCLIIQKRQSYFAMSKFKDSDIPEMRTLEQDKVSYHKIEKCVLVPIWAVGRHFWPLCAMIEYASCCGNLGGQCFQTVKLKKDSQKNNI